MSTPEVLTIGVPGPQGPPGIVPRGTWDADVTYAKGEAVLYEPDGSTYLAIAPTTGDAPPLAPLKWQIVAAGSSAAALAAAQAAIDEFNADTAALVDLPAAGAITGAELALLSQAGVDVKATLSAILTALAVLKTGGTFTGDIAIDIGAAGVARIQNVGGVTRIALFANNTDAEPYVSLGSALGAPLLGFGPGGATVPDAYITRTGVGEIGAFGNTVFTAPRVIKPVAVTTNRSFALSDLAKVVEVNNAALRTQTIPLNSAVAFPVGCFLRVRKIGTGDVAIAAAAGVTLRDPDALGNIVTQWETRVLHQRVADEWIMAKGIG